MINNQNKNHYDPRCCRCRSKSSDGAISDAESFLVTANEAVFGDVQTAKMKRVTAVKNDQVGGATAFDEGVGG